MKTNNNRPFQVAEIEIFDIVDDVITSSQNPFPGEDDDFSYYWNNN